MIVMVFGPHRSGNSALGGLLHTNGIVMAPQGPFIPGASSENPKGYYEDPEVRYLNDRILSANDNIVLDWDSPVGAPYTDCSENLFGEIMSAICFRAEQNTNWGMRDPRLSLTWPVWRRAFEELELWDKVILACTTRPLHDIVDSMIRAGCTPSADQEDRRAWFHAIAYEYTQSMLASHPDVLVDFNLTPEEIHARLGDVGIHVPNLSFLDQSLRNRS